MNPMHGLPGVRSVCAGLLRSAADGQKKLFSVEECATPASPHTIIPPLTQEGNRHDEMSPSNSGEAIGSRDNVGKRKTIRNRTGREQTVSESVESPSHSKFASVSGVKQRNKLHHLREAFSSPSPSSGLLMATQKQEDALRYSVCVTI